MIINSSQPEIPPFIFELSVHLGDLSCLIATHFSPIPYESWGMETSEVKVPETLLTAADSLLSLSDSGNIDGVIDLSSLPMADSSLPLFGSDGIEALARSGEMMVPENLETAADSVMPPSGSETMMSQENLETTIRH
ncbi:hypothetical protein OROHE_012161 [Orobanche hederae]